MKQLLLIIAVLFSVNASACNDHGKKQKWKCKLPPLEMRCTMEDKDGKWCKGWSVREEEYCWGHSASKREIKELRDAKAKLRMKK
jgi:uncharacterized lipoprotein YehR (DUF1307 family)